MSIIPAPSQVARNALLLVATAVAAAAIIGCMPGVRTWIRRQWGGDDPPMPF